MLNRILTTSAIVLLSTHFASAQLANRLKSEPADKLAADALKDGDAVRGAILFANPELACTTCHVAGGRDQLGPDLTQMKKQRTGVHFVESILFPSKAIDEGYTTTTVLMESGKSYTGRLLSDENDRVVLRETTEGRKRVVLAKAQVEEIVANKVSLMPDGLAGKLSNRQQFLDVIRYMIELRDTATVAEPIPASPKRQLEPHLEGLVLLDRLHCANCHTNDLLDGVSSTNPAPRLSWIAGRVDPGYLQKFIAQPGETKPGTAMPHVLSSLSDGERETTANELAHYIASRSERKFATSPIDGAAADRGRKLFHTVGCVACHSPYDDSDQALLAESSVSIGELAYSVSGLTDFLEDPLASRPSGHMPNMTLDHFEATEIANFLLATKQAKTADSFEFDPALAAAGEKKFAKYNCNACHGESEVVRQNVATAEVSLSNLNMDGGCLSGKSGQWPAYSISEADKSQIKMAISHFKVAKNLKADEQIHYTISKLRCTSCHERDGIGGVVDERDDYFTTANPNLGPQGRLPPPLTGVGAKLNQKWMREVLVSGRKIRPYMKTRMPQYGAGNVGHLVDSFQQQDELPKIEFPVVEGREPLKKMRTAGFDLVSNDGLNCIACHTFQLKPAMTMPAVDLTEMHERLQPDWFYAYMMNPKRFHRGTVMPSFWPGGKAARQDILDGDSHQQIAAIWEWMKEGRQARTPRGLVRKPMELLASNEAVMLRRSYPGIGKRGIGVGYPSQVNVAFDAEQMRMAMLWKGRFIDPSGVWRSQGHGRVRPLARKQTQFHPGPELDDAQKPWVVDDSRPPNHRFKGYELDELRRPKLQYQFEHVSVEDYAVDVPDTDKPTLLRTITLRSRSPRAGMTFRLAPKGAVVKQADNAFAIGEDLVVQVRGSQNVSLAKTELGSQIQIAIDLKASEAFVIELEYQWK